MSTRIPPEERRAEIIDAAIRCLLRQGYRSTSMDDIVSESGLSKGTIYWHFKNKKDLIIAVFADVLNQVLGDLENLFDPALTAGENLHSFLGSISSMPEETLRTTILPLKFMTELLHDDDFVEQYQKIVAEIAAQTQAIIERGIKEGEFREVDPFETSWMLMEFLDGIMLYYLLDMPGDTLKHCQIMADLVVTGLKK